jgi:putative ABC transport system permease protein
MLLALGSGFHKANLREMSNVVDGSFAVWVGKSGKSHNGYPRGQKISIKISDALKLPKLIPNIEDVDLYLMKTATISYAGKAYSKNIQAATPSYAQLEKIKLIAGSRFINQIDVEHQKRVAVIANKTKELLFGRGNALGLRFLINNIPFTVIGVLTKNERTNHNRGAAMLISHQSYKELYGDHQINFFFVSTKPNTNHMQFEQSLRSYLAHKYHFDKKDKDAIKIWGSGKIAKFMYWFFISIKLFLGACGTMVLAVGSVGVANIMFLIVTERTYEIGLRKAIGATDQQILLQLLFEALIIVGFGGCLGITMAISTITILQHVTLPNWIGVPVLSWTTIGITIFILSLIGLIAGYFPARRAAKIDPVESMMT